MTKYIRHIKKYFNIYTKPHFQISKQLLLYIKYILDKFRNNRLTDKLTIFFVKKSSSCL